MALPDEVAVSDPVMFLHGTARLFGHVAKKTAHRCTVVTSDGGSFRVPWCMLDKREDGERRQVSAPTDTLKARFRPGDEVQFASRKGTIVGKIARLNPSKAVVVSPGGDWRVAYSHLSHVNPDAAGDRTAVLEAVTRQARDLMARHGLEDWSFQFDDASSRAGACYYRMKVISMSLQFCLEAPEDELTDTILHEIAHALVGENHMHDSVWKRTARSIGCTGDRCHQVQFAPARYIVVCPSCPWSRKTNTRKHRASCAYCRFPVRYENYTDDRWKALGGKPLFDR